MVAYIIVHILFNYYVFTERYPDPKEKSFWELWSFPYQKNIFQCNRI